MKKYKISGIRLQPFSGIVEAENQKEAELILDNQKRIEHFILTGNLSVVGATIESKKLARVPDTAVINYY